MLYVPLSQRSNEANSAVKAEISVGTLCSFSPGQKSLNSDTKDEDRRDKNNWNIYPVLQVEQKMLFSDMDKGPCKYR